MVTNLTRFPSWGRAARNQNGPCKSANAVLTGDFLRVVLILRCFGVVLIQLENVSIAVVVSTRFLDLAEEININEFTEIMHHYILFLKYGELIH